MPNFVTAAVARNSARYCVNHGRVLMTQSDFCYQTLISRSDTKLWKYDDRI